MFRCDECGKNTTGKQNKIVTETRPKYYPPKGKGHSAGNGWEIVREIKVCKPCTLNHA